MGGRRAGREWALQFLFQRDFHRDETLEPALELFWSETQADPKDRRFSEDIIRGVEAHLAEIDERIKQYAENWDLKRMGIVDRNVMRIAFFEMLYRPDVPPVVSINEAVDIAKAFSSLESGKFVNGILDRACKELQRPARTALQDGGKPPRKKGPQDG